MPAEASEYFAIYNNAADFPGEFVVRSWLVHGFGAQATTRPKRTLEVRGKTLDLVRRELLKHRPGLVRLERFPQDDPTIVEVWI